MKPRCVDTASARHFLRGIAVRGLRTDREGEVIHIIEKFGARAFLTASMETGDLLFRFECDACSYLVILSELKRQGFSVIVVDEVVCANHASEHSVWHRVEKGPHAREK